MGADPRPERVGRIVWPVAWWLVATGVYVSFVSFVWTQVLVGSFVAAAAVALSRTAAREAGLRLQGVFPRLWPPRAVASIVAAEVAAVTAALVRRFSRRPHRPGRFVAFRTGETVDPELDASLTIEVSIAPNTYLVAVVDQDGDAVVLAHQFTERPDPRRTFPRWRR